MLLAEVSLTERLVFGVFLGALVALGVVAAVVAFLHERKRAKYTDASRECVELWRQQLHASDQERKGANQQREAWNQQLAASNRQLEATDQHLDASRRYLVNAEKHLVNSENFLLNAAKFLARSEEFLVSSIRRADEHYDRVEKLLREISKKLDQRGGS